MYRIVGYASVSVMEMHIPNKYNTQMSEVAISVLPESEPYICINLHVNEIHSFSA